MSIVAVKMALDTLLLEYPWITDPDKQVAWDDRDYKPQTGRAYLSVSFLINNPVDLFQELKGVEERGIYQINVMHKAGLGALGAYQIAEGLQLLFAPPQLIDAGNHQIELLETPYISGGQPTDDGWYMVPVSVNWVAMPVTTPI